MIELPRKCTICNHKQVSGINQAIIEGRSLRDIATQYSVHFKAVDRHKAEHLPAEMLKARDVAAVAQADNLLDQVIELQAKARELLSKAEAAGDLRTALIGVREAKGCLELLARLQGELQSGQVNLILAPEWVEMRAIILQAVEPYPEARKRLTAALKGAGDDL